jgi:hypothetical protein
LPEGTYSLTVESKGFEPVTVEGANVRAQYPLQLDFRLNETARARESPAMTAGSSAPIPNFFSNESTYDDASNSQRSVLRSRRARRRASAQPGMSFHQRGLMSDRSQTQKLDYVIEKGQIIRVSLAGQLSSADAKVGDHFETSVVSPVYSGWNKAIPVGSFITGRVEDVKRAAITDGPGVLDVRFVSLRLPDGSRHEIEGRLADLPGDAARPPVSTVLSEYDFKRKVVFRGGDAVQPGTRITALLQSQGDSANLHSSMGLHTFTLPAANKREEAAVRRNEEFWVILKKSVKLPTSGNN